MNERIEELQAEQGWSDETVGQLALRWIAEHGHEVAFTHHLEEVAAEEEGYIAEDEDTYIVPSADDDEDEDTR